MLRRLSSGKLLRSLVALSWTGIVVKLFGLINQSLIARSFGAGAEMDAFNAAWAFPALMIVIWSGAIETTLVPTYVRAMAQGSQQAADRVLSTLINLCVSLMGLLTVVSIASAPQIIALTAPGFADDRAPMTLAMTSILYPAILVNVLAGLITSTLVARNAFALPTLAQAAVPLAMTMAVTLLASQMGIVAVAAGQLAGLVLQLGILIYLARRAGISYYFTIDLRDGHIRAAGRASIPLIAGSIILPANLFVDQVIASTLPAGELSAMTFALKLLNLPVIVVFGAFARATLPRFSEQAATMDIAGLKRSIRNASMLMLLLTIGMTIAAALLATPIIRIFFEGNRFTPEHTARVSAVFMAFAVGLAPMGLGFVIPRAFNALRRNEILAAITVFSVVSNYTLDVILAPRFGAVGIALATSIVNSLAIIIQIIILIYIMQRMDDSGCRTSLPHRVWRITTAFRSLMRWPA